MAPHLLYLPRRPYLELQSPNRCSFIFNITFDTLVTYDESGCEANYTNVHGAFNVAPLTKLDSCFEKDVAFELRVPLYSHNAGRKALASV